MKESWPQKAIKEVKKNAKLIGLTTAVLLSTEETALSQNTQQAGKNQNSITQTTNQDGKVINNTHTGSGKIISGDKVVRGQMVTLPNTQNRQNQVTPNNSHKIIIGKPIEFKVEKNGQILKPENENIITNTMDGDGDIVNGKTIIIDTSKPKN